jgi:hypothetical protein
MKTPCLQLVPILLSCAAFAASAAIHYVDVASPAPASPYATWATAATTIQDAVDAAVAGDQILVTNGLYKVGAQVVVGAMSNRVAVTKPVTVQSVNGPNVTIIQGYQVPGTTNGDSAVRCVYLTYGASLVGFTLTNGATRATGFPRDEQSGGGVACAGFSSVVSNCVITGNAAFMFGGGAIYGTLANCILNGNLEIWNSAWPGGGGGAAYSTLLSCTLSGNRGYHGGGAYSATLTNCTLTGNSGIHGGGADSSTLSGSALTGNSASYAGGASRGTLNNCTVTGNSAVYYGGGAEESTLNNCIIYFNNADYSPIYGNYYNANLAYCCTAPAPQSGLGNFTNAPLFADLAAGNLRLQPPSPCINAGLNAYASSPVDLDGSPRIVGGTVDVGAYEFQTPASIVSYAWLQQYGLPMDGSADFADSDGDGMVNWQEWIAGTNPTNAASVLRMLPPANTASGARLIWTSVSDRTYFIERATNLSDAPAFSLLQSNLAGLDGFTAYTDTNALRVGPFFYRVRVTR